MNNEKQVLLVKGNINLNEEAENFPFPIDIIPNYMGINLVSVNKVVVEKQPDGQIVRVEIFFIPNN